jgi:hypothetical protein
VGFPEIGSDATNKAYVDQRFLDTPIPWGMITCDDKPLLYSGTIPGVISGEYETCNFLEHTMIPAPESLVSLGLCDRPFLEVTTVTIQIKETLIAAWGLIHCKEDRVQHVASPEEDTDAATKGYVDNRADAAVTYLQGVIGDAVETINNLQDQVNNLMSTAALEIPSTTYVEFSFTTTDIQIYETSSIITLLYTNENTVYTNLRLVLKIIQEDGNLNKEVVFYASQPQGVLGAHNFTQKYSFNTSNITLSGSVYPALLKLDLMCDIYATGGARPTVLKSYVYNKKTQTTTRVYIGF